MKSQTALPNFPVPDPQEIFYILYQTDDQVAESRQLSGCSPGICPHPTAE